MTTKAIKIITTSGFNAIFDLNSSKYLVIPAPELGNVILSFAMIKSGRMQISHLL